MGVTNNYAILNETLKNLEKKKFWRQRLKSEWIEFLAATVGKEKN